MSEKRLQKRDEISDEYKWKLEDMYETDELWEAECEKASQLAERLSGFKGHLADAFPWTEYLRISSICR